jgi:UDP-glucuronate 4-epimerase
MRVLVTGAAGFIGSHLCDALLSENIEVVGIDNFNDYYSPQRKEQNIAHFQSNPHFTLQKIDIRDRTSIDQIFKEFRPTAVAHLAAMAGVRRSVEQPALYMDVNVTGSQILLDAARHVGSVESFVFASTSSVYGKTHQIPFLESHTCDRPLQPYAASKRAVELLAHSYSLLYGLSFTSVRFFTVYGPRGRPDMMPMLLAQSISEGTEIPFYGEKMERDWTYVADIVNGIRLALKKPLGYEILNLGRGEPVKLRTFIDTIESVSGGKATLVPREKPKADVFKTFADCSKAKKMLGYEPTVSVQEGVERLWEWYTSATQ